LDNWIVAIILGAVEGLTEFLPVSSTGHLILFGNLLGFVGEQAQSFMVAIQLGAILSVVALYHERFICLIPRRKIYSDQRFTALEGWNGLIRIGLAMLPALAIGFLARKAIKAHLFTPLTVTLALLVGGIIILLVEKFLSKKSTNTIDTMTIGQALGVGCFQVLSLWPGTSRSAATIIGGMMLGLDRKSAAEFSFIVAVPIMCVATGYELIKIAGALTDEEMDSLVIGFIVSFGVAAIAVQGFIQLINKWTLAPFGWYRIVAAPIFYLMTIGMHF
jgi:undecaprenyl-diphosphatase